jgi:hypothetical protein
MPAPALWFSTRSTSPAFWVVIHEDHSMMVGFDIGVTGDTKSNP